VLLTKQVAITGRRFITAAERIPIPDGLPLMVLHDPPGGASFASYTNVEVTTVTKTQENEVEDTTTKSFGGGLGIKSEISTKVGVGLTPLVLGTIPDPITLKLQADIGAGYTQTEGSSSTASSINEAATYRNPNWNENTGNTQFSFSYETSDHIERPGPPSDAFLVPAATFEVQETWSVRYYECNLFGDSDKRLVANSDLNGFYFLTANDAETRVLPTLKEAAADMKNLVSCASDTHAENCCSEIEKTQGCEIAPSPARPSIEQYCDWRYPGTSYNGTVVISTDDLNVGDRTSCYRIVDNVFKTKCLRKAQVVAAELRLSKPAVCYAGACKTHDFTSGSACPSSEKAVAITSCSNPTTTLGTSSKAEDVLDFVLNLRAITLKGISESVARKLLTNEGQTNDLNAAHKPKEFGCAWYCEPKEIAPIAQCSKMDEDVEAGNLEQYCKATTKTAGAAEECATFTPTDEMTVGHDNWYNTLERNYA
jgi:hypothetical protein